MSDQHIKNAAQRLRSLIIDAQSQNPILQALEGAKRRRLEGCTGSSDALHVEFDRATLNTLIDALQHEEGWELFMTEYTAHRFGRDPSKSWSPQYEGYLHLMPDEICWVLEFCHQHGFVWNGTMFQFTYDRPEEDHTVYNLLKFNCPVQDLFYTGQIDRHTTAVTIQLCRRTSPFPDLKPLIALQRGEYKGFISQSQWDWLCQEGIFHPERCRVFRWLQEAATIQLAKGQGLDNRYIVDGTARFQAKRFQQLVALLNAAEREDVCYSASFWLETSTELAVLRAWLSNILAEDGMIRSDDTIHRHHASMFRKTLQSGDLDSLKQCVYAPLKSFFQYLSEDDYHPFFADVEDMLGTGNFPFVIHHLLQSPLRDKTLQAFREDQREKLMQYLSMMNLEE